MEAHVLQGLLIMYKKRTVGSGSTRAQSLLWSFIQIISLKR